VSGGRREEVVLESWLSPGDIVMLTAAVRDLHAAHPGRFRTWVNTSCQEIWENSPYVERVGSRARRVRCDYPLIHRANEVPLHFIHGYRLDLEQKLGVSIPPTVFRGDIHLSEDEKGWVGQVEEMTGADAPFWIVVAGGKTDYTAKWWPPSYFQQVVNSLTGQMRFVQVGSVDHVHPKLEGVLDLRGRTDLRQLIRLVYHSEGVLCPVTSLMHLAAAIPTKNPTYPSRPCVVVAGGRESPHWEAYPSHYFLHTIGMLPCCAAGGCWRSRTLRLGDGSIADQQKNLCLMPSGAFPTCMHMIHPDQVSDIIKNILSRPTRLPIVSARP